MHKQDREIVRDQYDDLKRSLLDIDPEFFKDEYFLYKTIWEVNNTLWNLEDEIREALDKQSLSNNSPVCNELVVNLSIAITKANKERAKIKKEIDMKFNPELQEIKCYHGEK